MVKRKVKKGSEERKIKRFRAVSNVLIVCMLCALLAVTIGTQGAHSVFAISKQDVVYSGRTDTSSVALMINVYWGEEYLPQMLDTLDAYGAKATFFIGGCWADDHNALLKDIAERGHEIGNHGYFHKDGDKLDFAGNVREIRSTNALIAAITGITPSLFAPPTAGRRGRRGRPSTRAGRATAADVVSARAAKAVEAGDMILMHPTEHTAAALGRVLEYYKEKGLNAVTVSELLPPDKI